LNYARAEIDYMIFSFVVNLCCLSRK